MSCRLETCENCVQRALLVFWILLMVTDIFYLGIASASLAYFGDFQHDSFVYYRRANIETLVVAVLGSVTGAFGAFGTARVFRRVVLGAVLSLLATFVLLIVAAVSLRQMRNPFAEYDSSMATSEVMGNEIVEYVDRVRTRHLTGNVSTEEPDSVLRFMNVGQRIFQCCGKTSYRDYREAPVPKSCCRDPCNCPLRRRLPSSDAFDARILNRTGCLYNMYKWVVLVTLAGLNLAAFCFVASGCLLFSAIFLFLNRHKADEVRSVRTAGSLSQRSMANISMVLVVMDDTDKQLPSLPGDGGF